MGIPGIMVIIGLQVGRSRLLCEKQRIFIYRPEAISRRLMTWMAGWLICLTGSGKTRSAWPMKSTGPRFPFPVLLVPGQSAAFPSPPAGGFSRAFLLPEAAFTLPLFLLTRLLPQSDGLGEAVEGLDTRNLGGMLWNPRCQNPRLQTRSAVYSDDLFGVF